MMSLLHTKKQSVSEAIFLGISPGFAVVVDAGFASLRRISSANRMGPPVPNG